MSQDRKVKMSLICKAKGLEKSFRLNTGEAASCCKSYTEPFNNNLPQLLEVWQQESIDLTAGMAVPSCEQCWKDERAGKHSLRLKLNEHPALENKIDIYMSNLCNHMCSYCSPKFSSIWQTSVEQQGVFNLVSKSAQENQAIDRNLSVDLATIESNLDQIKQYVDSQPDNSVVISLLGGEPLMQHRGLHKILEFNVKKVKRLVIITNLNPPNTKFLNQILDAVDIKKLLMHVSIDTVPQYNHIPRNGFSQSRFDTNLDYIKTRGVEYTVLATTSVLSVFSLAEFLQWGNTHGVLPTFQSLQNPSALQISHLPREYKDEILNSVDVSVLPQELKWQLDAPEAPKVNQFEQYNYCRQYFNRTDTAINSFPASMQRWWQQLSDRF